MSFYEFLRSAPYVRLLLPFIIGIISGNILKVPVGVACIVLATNFSVFITINYLKTIHSFRTRWLWGLVLNSTIINLGFVASASNYHYRKLPTEWSFASGTIIENPRVTKSNYSALVRLEAVKTHNKWSCAGNKILCVLQKTHQDSSLILNQRILLRGNWKEIKNNGNPYEFDYKGYMNRKGIFYSIYADSTNWKPLGQSQNFNIMIWSLKLRDKILDYFRQLDMSSSAFAVISALTMGDQSYLDAEIKRAYVNSGTIHILAVSGMHVALLFWLLQQITRPLMRFKKGYIPQTIIVLAVIWFYALITGLSPSVVRASVMFTFWMLGKVSNRNTNIYNTLSASALLLLIINPDTLFDVGFQLSYMAVLGIVVFYKDIYDMIYVRTWIGKQVWTMIAVSISAQLFTLPITLYNFHQFPNYFILANIIAIPLSTLVLYGTFFTLLLAPFEVLRVQAGHILKIMVDGLNGLLVGIERLPYSVTSGIWISTTMSITLFFIIGFGRSFLKFKRTSYLFIVLASCIILLSNIYLKLERTATTEEIIVYNVPKSVVIQFRKGFESCLLTDSFALNTERLVKPVDDHLYLHRPRVVSFNNNTTFKNEYVMLHKGFVAFKDKRIYIWENKPNFKDIPVKVDLLVIKNLKKKDLKEVTKYFNPHVAVISPKVFYDFKIKLKEQFMNENIPCIVVDTDGAWVSGNIKKSTK